MKNALSLLEYHLLTQIKMLGLPEPVPQFQLLEDRRYRWDFAWPEFKLLVEVQGGTWSQGAHGRGKGISRDCEKLNLAALQGWRQMSFTTDQINTDKAILMLKEFFSDKNRQAGK